MFELKVSRLHFAAMLYNGELRQALDMSLRDWRTGEEIRLIEMDANNRRTGRSIMSILTATIRHDYLKPGTAEYIFAKKFID